MTQDSKHTPTPLEVGSFGRTHSTGDPLHYAIMGPVGAGRIGSICDTLNCDHLLTHDEQHAWLEKFVRAYNAHEPLVKALREARERLHEAPMLVVDQTAAKIREKHAALEYAQASVIWHALAKRTIATIDDALASIGGKR